MFPYSNLLPSFLHKHKNNNHEECRTKGRKKTHLCTKITDINRVKKEEYKMLQEKQHNPWEDKLTYFLKQTSESWKWPCDSMPVVSSWKMVWVHWARRNSRWLEKKKYSSALSSQKLDTLQDKQGRVTPAPCFLTSELNSRETSWCTDISLVICKSQRCTPAWLSQILLRFPILWTKTGFGKKKLYFFKFYTYDLHI